MSPRILTPLLLVLCILALALYPQLILHRTAPTVQQTVASVTGGKAPEAQLAEKHVAVQKAVAELLTRPVPPAAVVLSRR